MKKEKITVIYKNETEKYQVIGYCETTECLYSGTKKECINFIHKFCEKNYIEETKYSSLEIVAPGETVQSDMIQTEYTEKDFEWLNEYFKK